MMMRLSLSFLEGLLSCTQVPLRMLKNWRAGYGPLVSFCFGCSWGATLSWFHAKIFQTSISSFLDAGRRIGVNPVITDQARLEPMDALIESSSLADADQVLSSGNPLNGGGPLKSMESTYRGTGLRVDLTGRLFEFPACSSCVGGADVSGASGGEEDIVSDSTGFEALEEGLPRLGRSAMVAPSLR